MCITVGKVIRDEAVEAIAGCADVSCGLIEDCFGAALCEVFD